MSVHGVDPLKQGAAAPAGTRPRPTAGAGSFSGVLETKLADSARAPLKLSSHAAQRIQRREISFDGPVAARLEAAVDRAAAKGSRDSLVLVDSTAFVVSVRNRTVITAVPVSPMNDQVFTNVDSAVIG